MKAFRTASSTSNHGVGMRLGLTSPLCNMIPHESTCVASLSAMALRALRSASMQASTSTWTTCRAATSLRPLARQMHHQWPGARLLTQQYLQYVNKCVVDSMSPYLRHALPWTTWQALVSRAGEWLPALYAPRFHIPVLGALNLVGAGLPHTLALVMAELLRSGGEALALAPSAGNRAAPDAEALAAARAAAARPWWRSHLARLATTVWHVVRLTWLLLIFTPVFLSAPLALRWNVYRAEWMELLRKTLETAGAVSVGAGGWALVCKRHLDAALPLCTGSCEASHPALRSSSSSGASGQELATTSSRPTCARSCRCCRPR